VQLQNRLLDFERRFEEEKALSRAAIMLMMQKQYFEEQELHELFQKDSRRTLERREQGTINSFLSTFIFARNSTHSILGQSQKKHDRDKSRIFF